MDDAAVAIPGRLRIHRALVLEDNEFQREVIAATLASLGVGHVSQASNGHDALGLIVGDRRGYDLVLCDLHMADSTKMDGIEFIRTARNHRIGSLILMSGIEEDLFASAEMLAAGHGAPLIGRLHKPVDPHELCTILQCPLAVAPGMAAGAVPSAKRKWSKMDLRVALKREQFVPFFQPKIHLSTGRVIGAEVLVRWQHPEFGILSPSEFIPLMEKHQMIDGLTDHLMRRVAAAIGAWSRAGLDIPLALNASPTTLQDVSIPNRWRSIVAEHHVDPEMLTIEVTETAVANDFHGLLETLTRLRMHGFGVSLDDFGTGYSSLQQLSELPLTEVKIDRAFVMRAPASSRAVLILDTIIQLSKKLGLTSVAEGIETQEMSDFLRMSGCDNGQGLHFAAPMSASALCGWVATRNQPRFTVSGTTVLR